MQNLVVNKPDNHVSTSGGNACVLLFVYTNVVINTAADIASGESFKFCELIIFFWTFINFSKKFWGIKNWGGLEEYCDTKYTERYTERVNIY